jgi:hypothetical protein
MRRAVSGYLLTGVTVDARPGSTEVADGTLSSAAVHSVRVRLTHGVRPAGDRGEDWLKRGLPSSQ